jgi:hypothetical protein
VGAVLLVLAIIGAYWVVTHPVRRYVDANGQVVVRRMGQAEWARIEPMLNEKGEWVGEGESPGAGEGSPAEGRAQRQRPGDDRAATPAPSRPADRVPAPGEALVVGDRRVRVPTAALDVDPLSRRWHVIGTVWNAGDHPLASLRLQVEVVDASGARWGEVPQAVELRYLPVGDSVPFSTPVTGLDPDEKYGFRVTVLEAEADPTLVCVLLENYSVEPDKEGRNVVLTVEGEARNPTGAAMAGPMVYCTFYDQRGIALGSRTGSLPDTPQRLAPGATAPFRVRYDTGMRFMPGTISALPRLVGRRGS